MGQNRNLRRCDDGSPHCHTLLVKADDPLLRIAIVTATGANGQMFHYKPNSDKAKKWNQNITIALMEVDNGLKHDQFLSLDVSY